ncbi:MAG: helix-turn-helix domain-containing protein [Chloroflexi bacterium]|nr:hypothetical protein [Chloroflexota bacterium]NOG64983.1 helix-turn-helix domain-containing protein [Chloroflexota bacterium]
MKTIIRSRFKEHLYRMSLERGGETFTQKRIAEETGLMRKTVSLWLDMQKPLDRIDTSALIALSKYVGCHPLDLLVVEEMPNDN